MNAAIPEDQIFGYMELNNGCKVVLDDPDPAMLDIQTIAHALSNLCRFAGQVNKFYSVAQHSVLVSYLVPEEHAFAALMHDATEAFCADIPKPIKQLLPQYEVIEGKFWKAIAKRYDLPVELPVEVHIADRIAVITEARDLLNSDGWKQWYPDLEPDKFTIKPQIPAIAKIRFMMRYDALTSEAS